MNRNEMIKKYDFENKTFTARELDEIVHDINEANNWDIDKFISFDTVTINSWQINFWGLDENIIFQRIGELSSEFKAVL